MGSGSSERNCCSDEQEPSRAGAMARAQHRVDCQAYAQTNTGNQGRVLDAAEAVGPRDADEAAAERLAHGGRGDAVDEEYDTKIKIGEALEAAARAERDRPLERSDAAAIRAAEERAVGPGETVRGGVAEQAAAAAESNATAADKVTIGDVLTWNSTAKLPTDKAVTGEDAAAAVEAEAACAPGEAIKPYGVGAALAEAARHNQEESS
uniref:Uncharacterized protein n=1 Tax=Avena sativa TaxID=4498 RepID=A0ACD5WAA7_AVESA